MRNTTDIFISNISKSNPLVLTPDTLHHLKQISEYTNKIESLIQDIDCNNLAKILMINIPFQNALIFCFKIIGMHIVKASMCLNLKISDMPFFWNKLRYLRNSLVHYSPTICMSKRSLTLLAKIVLDVSFISAYFDRICETGNIELDVNEKEDEVFRAIHKLGGDLRKKIYAEDALKSIDQKKYLSMVVEAIGEIRNINAGMDLTHKTMQEYRHGEPSQFQIYLALQNFCEVIATITNPNSKPVLLQQSTLTELYQRSPTIEMWLKSLRESRGYAMHASGFMEDRGLVTNIKRLFSIEEYFVPPTSSESFSESFPPLNSPGGASSVSCTKVVRSSSYAAVAGSGGFFRSGSFPPLDRTPAVKPLVKPRSNTWGPQ